MKKRFAPLLAMVAAFTLCLAAEPVEAARKVYLELANTPGGTCVEVDPGEADIHKKGFGKTKRVEWKAETEGHYWKIEFKPFTDPVTGKLWNTDYLGAVPPIECAENSTESGAASKDFSGQLQWHYKILVYECDNSGQQGNLVCEQDPMVRIKD